MEKENLLALLGRDDWMEGVWESLPILVRNPDAVATLRELASHEDWRVRAGVAKIASWIHQTGAFDILIEALQDTEALVRELAAQGLGQRQATRGVQPLVNILKSDTEARVRRAAVVALGDIQSPAAALPVAAALRQDADENVRAAAARALRRIGGYTAIIPLLESLSSDNRKAVRLAARDALQTVSVERHLVPLLAHHMGYEHPRVCGAATAAIRTLARDAGLGDIVVGLRDGDINCHDSAVHYLKILGGLNPSILQDALWHHYEFIRAAARSALSEIEGAQPQ